jgi:hypothetical protein
MRIFPKTSLSLLLWMILILAVPAGHALASRSPQAAPVVDAGPPKTLALPATEVTLFGHSGDPEHDQVSWTLVSGPGAARF